MLVFKIIERNIYKKPSIHPVSFIKVIVSVIFIEWLRVCVSILLFMSTCILNAQAGDLESHFTSEMMEPVFHEDQEIVQMLVVAENVALLELSSVSLVKGFVYFIATYYIFNVNYPLVIVSLHCTSYKTYFWQGQMQTQVGL